MKSGVSSLLDVVQWSEINQFLIGRHYLWDDRWQRQTLRRQRVRPQGHFGTPVLVQALYEIGRCEMRGADARRWRRLQKLR